MIPHINTLPSIVARLCRRPLLHQCRVCYSTYNASIYKSENAHAYGIKPGGSAATRTERQRVVVNEVDRYIRNLDAGELFDGNKWEQIFEQEGYANVEIEQASRLFTFARAAKVLTPQRYYVFLKYLLEKLEIVPAQLGINSMIEDGVRLANWQYLSLAVNSIAEYTLFLRILALMDLDAPDYAVNIPLISRLTKSMLDVFHKSTRGAKNGTNLGHIMHMVPHMNSLILEIICTSTEEPAALAHAYTYISRTGVLPTMKIYEHFTKFLPVNFLPTMYQQIRLRGLTPPPELCNIALERYAKVSTGSDFVITLANDAKLFNYKHSTEASFVVLNTLLQAKDYQHAYESLRQVLEGPFTRDAHQLVAHKIGRFAGLFEGTPYVEPVVSLVQQFAAINQFIDPHAGKEMRAMDDEW